VKRQYRFPALLGDDSAEQLRELIREAEFVVVRMPGGNSAWRPRTA
jgi:hypothetical protein